MMRPPVAKTPEKLAVALGLAAADVKEWRVQHNRQRRLREIVRKEKISHAHLAKRADILHTRVTAILNDDLDHVSTDLVIRLQGSLSIE